MSYRVLHLDSGREMRGGQWQVLRLLDGLRRHGVESTLLSPSESPLFRNARDSGHDVQPLGLWAVRQLSRHADIVHAHDARSHSLAAFMRASPLLVSRRVAFPLHSRWKYRQAERYAAVSQFVKGVLIEGGVPEDKISVVYDGVPLPGAAGTGDRLLALASADLLKGEALARQAAQIAGVPLYLTRALEFDLPQAGLFLYLTSSEGLGSAILMAMAAGVPVIASNIGGIPEIIRHGENGWLVDNEPEKVATAIRDVLGDPALAQRLAACARQTVVERFTVEHMVVETIRVYGQVVAC
ncbi:MAG: glycosyltransferase family 4 protein [Bryobacteraceae bacterium]